MQPLGTTFNHYLGWILLDGSIHVQQSQMQVLPKFRHDCPQCVFLGQFSETLVYDLYYCDQISLATVIARYSDVPHEYYSGLGAAHLLPPLAAAVKMTQKLKLIPPPIPDEVDEPIIIEGKI